ncbi:MAG TPA: nuclear transport factor 2 family protein [Pyrinomonadaceae bacterium]
MQRILAAALMTILICMVANAQATAKEAKDSKVEQTLMQLERNWSAAYLRHDTAAIDRILADDYVGIDGRGVMTNKAQEIEDAKGPKPGEPEPAFLILDDTITDMKVRVYGNVSIINRRSVEKVKIRGKETNVEYRRTTVWVKRDGRWQCVSFHGSRILQPQG